MPLDQDLPKHAPPQAEVEENGAGVFYRGARPFDELEIPPVPEVQADDYDWAMQDPQVRQQYGGLVVAVHRRRVWGAGKSQRGAWEQARAVPGCPPLEEFVFVIVSAAAPEDR